jgi:hypothetical protein
MQSRFARDREGEREKMIQIEKISDRRREKEVRNRQP